MKYISFKAWENKSGGFVYSLHFSTFLMACVLLSDEKMPFPKYLTPYIYGFVIGVFLSLPVINYFFERRHDRKMAAFDENLKNAFDQTISKPPFVSRGTYNNNDFKTAGIRHGYQPHPDDQTDTCNDGFDRRPPGDE